MHPLRGIGLLTVLLSFGALVGAIAADASDFWRAAGITAAALLTGIVGLRARGITSRARTAASAGLAVALVATGVLVADPARTLAPTLAATLRPTATAEQPVVAPPAAESNGVAGAGSQDVVQAAGTLGYLLENARAASGTYPATLPVSTEGIAQTPAGVVQLPAGASVVYALSTDGLAVSATVTGLDGRAATYDSTAGGVLTG